MPEQVPLKLQYKLTVTWCPRRLLKQYDFHSSSAAQQHASEFRIQRFAFRKLTNSLHGTHVRILREHQHV